jgi:hypothetical protein
VVAVVALSLVFLCGAFSGALFMDLRLHAKARPPAFGTVAGKAVSFDRLQRELQLTPVQSEQMQSVLNDFWQYYRTVLSEGKTRVEQLLTDEQRRKFERLLQEYQPQ